MGDERLSDRQQATPGIDKAIAAAGLERARRRLGLLRIALAKEARRDG